MRARADASVASATAGHNACDGGQPACDGGQPYGHPATLIRHDFRQISRPVASLLPTTKVQRLTVKMPQWQFK